MNKNLKMTATLSKGLIGLMMTIVLYKGNATAQETAVATKGRTKPTISLALGDPAPALSYSKWIQGPTPITKIEKDKIYVIEFWATWCGPCIAAMPHLSELAKKYTDKIDFIGADVMENSYDRSRKQESYLQKVTEFVKQQYKLGKLTYNVIADNNAEDLNKNWLEAAGIDGIPSSFVVQNGKIAWIGHPHYIDPILEAIVAGTYDIESSKKNEEKSAQERAKYEAQQAAGKKLYNDALVEKDYSNALRLTDTAMNRYPNFKYIFATDKFKILNDHFGEDRAIAYGREMMKDRFLGQIIALAFMDGNLAQTQKMKDFAIETMKNLDPEGKNVKVIDVLAQFQANAGYYKAAAATSWKAVEVAKEQLKDPKSGGTMTQEDVNALIKKAEAYQKKAN